MLDKSPKKVRVFLIKHALTSGIRELEGKWTEPLPPKGLRYFSVPTPAGWISDHFPEHEIAETRDQALKAFEDMKIQKLEALERQRKNLIKLKPKFKEL